MTTLTPAPQGLFLMPGALVFGQSPLVLRTLLGSCVSVIVWHPTERLGGMCHFLLPDRPQHHGPQEPDGRFGAEALTLLVEQIEQQPPPLHEYTVHICGGANCFSTLGTPPLMNHIGQQNVVAADTWCQQLGLNVQQRHTGGFSYRHVLFDVDSGQLTVREGSQQDYEWLYKTP